MNSKGFKKGVTLLGIVIALLFILQPLSTVVLQEDPGAPEPALEDNDAGVRTDMNAETTAEDEELTGSTAADEIDEFNDETRSARKYLDAFKLNFDPYDPEEGQRVEVTADIKNKGNEEQTAKDVNVEFWLDGDTFIDSAIIEEIEPGSEESVTIDWYAVAGDHEITVSVDPDGNSGGPDEITKSISVDEANYSPHLYNAYPYQAIRNEDEISFIVKLTNRGSSRDSFGISMSKEYDGTSAGWTITKDRSEVNDLDSGAVTYINVDVSYDETNPVYYKEAKVTLKATSRGDSKKMAEIELKAAVTHDKPILFIDDDDQQNDVDRGHYQVSPDQHGPQTDEFTTTLLDYFYPGMWDKATLPGDSQGSGYMGTQARSGPPYDSSNGVSQDRDDNNDPIYLENYDLVIWDTGYSETVTANTQSGSSDEGLGGPFPDDGSTATHNWYDQQELTKYLDNGGAFWWMNNKGVEWHDQDAGTISNAFIRNYFHVEKVFQSVGLGNDIIGVGSDPIGRGVSGKNSYIYGVMGDRAEILVPQNDAYGVIYSGSYYSAIRYEYNTINEPTFRTLYQAGNIASYGDWNYYSPMRMKYFEQAVSWLGVPVYMPPETDIGIEEINSPLGGLVEPGGDIPLDVAVRNYGQEDLDVDVDFRVLDKDDNNNEVFKDTVAVEVRTGETLDVDTTWSNPQTGRRYQIEFELSTSSGDEDATNNKETINVTATDYKDVGVVSVDCSKTTFYWNTTRPGDETDIFALLHNYGSEYATFKAELKITSPLETLVYIDSIRVEDLAPGGDIEVTWSWTPHKSAGVITAWHADSRDWNNAYDVTVTAVYSDDQNDTNDEGHIGDGNTEGMVAMAYDDTSNPAMMDHGKWIGVDLEDHGDPSHPTPIHPAYFHMESPPASWTACVEDDEDDWGYVYPNWDTCVISPKLDFSDYTDLEGNWLMGGHQSRGTFSWQYSLNFDGTYETDNVEAATWTNIYSWSGGSNAWGWYIYSGGTTTVNNFAGEDSVYMRLRFVSSVSSKQRMSVFVDDIGVTGVVNEYNFPDLAMEKLSVSPALDSAGVQRTIDMTIHNSGQVDTSNRDDVYVNLDIQLDGESLKGYPRTLDVTETIGINERTSLSQVWTPDEDGDYTITATVVWEDQDGTHLDSDGRNDDETVMAYAKFTAFYDDGDGEQKFDGGVEGTPLPNTWDLGEPTSGPGFAHSGDNVWATNLVGNYPNYDGGLGYIETDIDLRTVADPVLSFWHWLEVEGSGYDTARVRVRDRESRAGDWVTIWKNPDPEEFGEPYATDGWEFLEIPLTNEGEGYDFGYSEIDLRFELETDGDTNFEGWYLDDIGIGGSQPPERDASLDGVIYPPPGGFVFPGSPVTLKIKVSNVGTADTSIPIEVKIYEVIFGTDEELRDTLNVESSKLGAGKSTILNAEWQVPYSDNTDYHLYFSTKLVNDENNLNDNYDMYLLALQVHDIGVLDLYAKPIIQNLNFPRIITAQLQNFGNVEEMNIKVTLSIRDRTDNYHYTAVKYVDIFPQDTTKVEFKWTSIHFEEYYITVNVTLEGDHDEDYTGAHRNELEIREIRTVERIFYDNCESTPIFLGESDPDFWEVNGDGFESNSNSAGWHNVDIGHQSEESYYSGIPAQNGYANLMNAQLVSAKMDLDTITDAKLRFYTKFYVEGRKYDNIHISIRSRNHGWEEISRYPEFADINSIDYSTAVNGWLMREFDIDDKFLEEDFQLRFVFKTDSDLTLEGVYIDDISIFASPTTNHPPHARFSATWRDNVSYSVDLIRYPTPEIQEITQGDLDYIKLPKPEQGQQGGVPLVEQKTELITLDATYSFDPDILDQDDLDYVWDFGDGDVEVGGAEITHEFEMTDDLDTDPLSGKKYFNVSLTVRDATSDEDDYMEEMTDYLWIFAGNTPPEADFQVYSGDLELTDVDDEGEDGSDPVPSNGHIDVFWGDVLEFTESASDPEGKLNRDSFVYTFSTMDDGEGNFDVDKTVYAGRLKVEVGGKLVSKDGQTTNFPGTFFGEPDAPPASQTQPHIYTVGFTARDLGGEQATQYKMFKVYPYARKTYTDTFLDDNNEELTPKVEIEWRGFTDEAANNEAEIHPETRPVFVKIEPIDSPTGIDPLGSLGNVFKVTVQGTKLQSGKTGYKSLTMYMPYSYSALDELGSAVNLREDVMLYEYSKDIGRTFIEIEGSGSEVINSVQYAKGTKEFTGRGSSTSDEVSVIVAPIVKSVNDGTARPDLTIAKIEFSRNRVILGTEVEIRAYINNVGETHAKDFSVRFLDGDSTIGQVESLNLNAGEREFMVTMIFNATDTDIGTPGEPAVEHDISVTVDADRDIFEGTPGSPEEENNKETKVFEVIEYAPAVTPSFTTGLIMAATTASIVGSLAILVERRRKRRR